jgi:CelD/BcsL family acetyltransferase involved in cellulose biosynthesis
VNQLQSIQLESLTALRAASAAWDDLWQRSDVTAPTARAELVAQWVEQFAPGAPFCALVVERAGVWYAALPLVRRRLLHMVRAGQAPTNGWVPGARLLLDPASDVPRVLDTLALGLKQLDWDLLWLDHVPLENDTWRALAAAIGRAGIPCGRLDRYAVARLDVDHDWPGYTRRLPGDMRREIGRSVRRLQEQGPLRLDVQTAFTPATLETCLRRGFAVEHQGWKGRAGSSVIAAGLLEFFLRQSQPLAHWGNLHLATLECGDQAVAFSYGMVAKGVYHGCKIGYHADYARFGPGQLLIYRLAERLWQDPSVKAFDFTGELTAAEQRWQPTTYRVGRLVAGLGRPMGTMTVYAHEHWWPTLRVWRHAVRRRNGAQRRQEAVHG